MSIATTRMPGLTNEQVAERMAAGLRNVKPSGPDRTTGDVIKANTLTRFNLLITVLVVVIVFVAPIQDALFGLVMVINSLIGIFQELRAKLTLDKLRLIQAPHARVIRNGVEASVAVDDVVQDDELLVGSADQIIVDGTITNSRGLEIDESLLTGEADPVAKKIGDYARSGSFVVAGSGSMRAEQVGTDSFAAQLAMEARKFTLVNSEIRSGIDTLLMIIGWMLIPIGAILIIGQLTQGFSEAATGAVAGLVAMIPQGLVLLTSVAFAVAVVRLGRHRVLVQELPAVETLARVDVVCFDKTGTLTEGTLRLVATQLISGDKDTVRQALGAISRVEEQPNATARLLADATGDPGWRIIRSVPFSSDRKWSGASFHGHGTWILGAPDIIVPNHTSLAKTVAKHTNTGRRVIALACTNQALKTTDLPSDLVPWALIIVGDTVRPDARSALDYFANQGVAVKIISGDDPRTVASIARAAGVAGSNRVVDGSRLPTDPARLRSITEQGVVFGRITPHQKKALILALQANGHTVAMTGDGVNDVLALKEADIGVAMGGGSDASRAVSQLILLDGTFDALPHVVAEGRRVIGNIERVSNLFLTKTVYAMALAVATSLSQLAYPFLPRQLSLVGALTIGIPGFFLALQPSSSLVRPGFLLRVFRFAVPTGLIAAAATYSAYGLARSQGVPLVEARTTATLVLVAVNLFALLVVSRPLTTARQVLVMVMTGLFILTMALESARVFYELPLPSAIVIWASIGIAAFTGAIMYTAWQLSGWIAQGGVHSFVAAAVTLLKGDRSDDDQT